MVECNTGKRGGESGGGGPPRGDTGAQQGLGGSEAAVERMFGGRSFQVQGREGPGALRQEHS